MLQDLVQVFWHYIERHSSSSSAQRLSDPRLDQARHFIETHYDQPFSLAESAAQANLATAHFCHLFAKHDGVPPREYAMRLRMQRGAHLLSNHELAVYEVAEIAGCPDSPYFSHLSRKGYGRVPINTGNRNARDRIRHLRWLRGTTTL